MVYNLDSQRAFSKQSKVFEASDASIVGMVNAKEQLVHDMEEVSALEGESMTKKFYLKLFVVTCKQILSIIQLKL